MMSERRGVQLSLYAPSLDEIVKSEEFLRKLELGIDYMKQNGVGVVEFLENADDVDAAVKKLKTDFSEM